MCRVLAVLEFGDRMPSGIVRVLAFRDLFAVHGLSVEVLSRQPIETIDRLRSPPLFLRPFVRRPGVNRRLLTRATEKRQREIVRRAHDVDVVLLSKVMCWPLIRAIREETSARIVLDFGDALWLGDASSVDEFNKILTTVDAVTTDNELTAEYVRQFNPNCVVVPDSPQLEEFDKRRAELCRKPEDRFVLGWIGSPSTLYNLYVIWEALEVLFQRHDHLHLRLVGTGTDSPNPLLPPFERVRYSTRPWYNQRQMIEEVFPMHVGLFPLQDVEKCRVRGVLKAAVYMSGEVAVVGSPVGQCVDLIEDGVNGLLAGSTQDWIDKLESLITDAGLRNRLAQAGLDTVRSDFRLEDCFGKLKEALVQAGRATNKASACRANSSQPSGLSVG